LQVAGYWLQVAGYWLQVAGYWLQVAGQAHNAGPDAEAKQPLPERHEMSLVPLRKPSVPPFQGVFFFWSLRHEGEGSQPSLIEIPF
jgi:hypothetical protein